MDVECGPVAPQGPSVTSGRTSGRPGHFRPGVEGLCRIPDSARPDRSTVRATVGKFLGICTGESLLVGVITNVVIDAPALAKNHGWHSTADVDLVGEIR